MVFAVIGVRHHAIHALVIPKYAYTDHNRKSPLPVALLSSLKTLVRAIESGPIGERLPTKAILYYEASCLSETTHSGVS